MKSMTRLLTAAVATAALLLTTAACGDSDAKPAANEQLSPAERGPQNVSGQATCVFIDSPAECKDSGVPEDRWFKAPTDEPPARAQAGQSDDDHEFLMDLFLFQMIYSQWFASPHYVNHYVVAEHRDSYRSSRKTFDTRYADREKASRAHAKYRTASGKVVTGDKIGPDRFQPAAPRNAGGDRGKKVCNTFTLDRLRKPGGGSGGGGSGGSRGGTSGGGSKPGGGSQPKAPAPKPPVGGDRGKGGTNQHGC